MFSTVFIVLTFTILSCLSANIPNYIHICKRSDPDVAKCIMNSIEVIRPRLKKGITELGVPALEPLRIHDLDIGRGSPNFKADLTNIDVFGSSDFQIHKLKVNVPTLTFRVQVTLPLLRLSGHYDVNARILVVPFKGQGKFHANATQCTGTAVLKGSLNEQNGVKRLHFTKLDLKLQIGDYNIKLESGANSDPIIIQAANDVFNQNRKDFIEIAAPFIETRVSEMILEIANDIVKNFEYDEVFPEK
ncbi:hypothetical protein RN001_007475 [Aquatica leii]|uniref:Uncharacterized protein n=1 Tax=Aquatica leii TaxID=1421715 RepID=A0AAN7SGU7_9COLE|nr:hypothetical protein RN001_007475 [Aquatica leii]